ncbi:MAG TPA: DinB family protein [Candidatus Limnocylindrales bacterium]|nr:DinB family protein [Candidatus Limnocylindrales bacterium]
MRTTTDPTLDRLLRHMAWANAALFDRLAAGSDEDLALAAPHNDWPAGRILAHLVNAAGGYAARLEGLPRVEQAAVPTTVGELASLAARCAGYDARIRAQAAFPDGPASYDEPGADVWQRSTVAAQAIHHATEHRAQIAGALATNGVDTIDLDALDLWAFTEAEDGGA